jgi:DNA-binding IclR family transcriptional regulator
VSSLSSSSTDRERVDGGLSSVASALDVLCLFHTEAELGVTEIARRLGVAKSTAHRLVTTLHSRGFVQRNDETGGYGLGLRLHELGRLAAARSHLRRTAMPLLESLRVRTGHTIHLAVPDGKDIIYVERLQSRRESPYLGDIGHRLPAHVTASGKVIAAFSPHVAEARRSAGFPAWTPSSIRSQASYDAALDEVRRNGFAVNDQEAVLGMTTVAAAVRDREGHAHAAISIVSATRDLDGAIARQARLVTAAAQRLAHDLCL